MVTVVRGILVAIVIAVSAASVVAASPASADSGDAQYLAALKASELGCGQGPFDCPTGDADMIQIGHSICRQLRGNSQMAIAQAILRVKPGMPPGQAVALVSAAKAAYCPS
jgi:Protein of unknown function (DUF732)